MRIVESGSGPAVLLVHGTPSSSESFAPVVRALARTHRVLVVDLPGYRGTPALGGTNRFDRTQRLLERELLARGVHALDLVGLSGGAFRVLELSLAGRLEVGRTVMLGGYAGLEAPVLEGFRALGRALRDGLELRGLVVESMIRPASRTDAAVVAEVTGWVDCIGANDLADELDSFAEFLAANDLRPRLGALRSRVHVLVGELDRATPAAHAEEMRRLNPEISVEIVPGHGHALLVEDPERTLAGIRRGLGLAG